VAALVPFVKVAIWGLDSQLLIRWVEDMGLP
jgi:hypothetical protein